MRHKMLRAAAVLLCAMGLTAAYYRTRPAADMENAAKQFLAALSAEQKAQATFKFDEAERLNWHFIPRVRKGLPFKQMEASQRQLAHGLLSAGLSSRGYRKATTVISLEEVLRGIEKDTTGRRDSDGYFFSIFGEPAAAGTWGWRVEGHHLSLNFSLVKGQMLATSPSFFGANPGEVRHGPRQGLRALAREEDLARELVVSLDAKQKALAVLEENAPKDIITMNKLKADIGDPKGVTASKLNKKQAEMLMTLIEEYAANMPEDVAAARMEAARKAGADKLYFGWAGTTERGKGHYYRVQSPTFLIEYDNTQNDANHIHSVWRDFNGDFGLDLLAAHYQQSHLAAR